MIFFLNYILQKEIITSQDFKCPTVEHAGSGYTLLSYHSFSHRARKHIIARIIHIFYLFCEVMCASIWAIESAFYIIHKN